MGNSNQLTKSQFRDELRENKRRIRTIVLCGLCAFVSLLVTAVVNISILEFSRSIGFLLACFIIVLWGVAAGFTVAAGINYYDYIKADHTDLFDKALESYIDDLPD